MLCLHQTIKIGKDEPVGLEGNANLHYAKELIAGHYGNDPALVPFDFPHILVALAPRPLFINAPLHDSNVKVSGVRDCVDAAMPVYDDVFRAKERLVAIYADAGHEFPSRIRAAAYAFAARLGANTPEVARDRAESFRLVEGAAGDGGVRAQFARPLTFLAVITALVLVVACTNFTNLMFARAEARRREFLIRLALGGGQWRLIRESAAECLALAAIAGALALLFASWASPMAMSLVSALEPLDFAIGLNASWHLPAPASSPPRRSACGRACGWCARP